MIAAAASSAAIGIACSAIYLMLLSNQYTAVDGALRCLAPETTREMIPRDGLEWEREIVGLCPYVGNFWEPDRDFENDFQNVTRNDPTVGIAALKPKE
jgi:hypothetical protein